MEFDGSSGALKKEYVYGGGMQATIDSTNGTQYTTADILGSPRVVTNSSGSVVSRHDYMPFGEELFAGTGGRTSGIGFGGADGIRKKFTGYERDGETGLDFAEARYFASTQGRFNSPDPLSGHASDPQSWNRYAYVGNNPLTTTDPTGMAAYPPYASVGKGGEFYQGSYMMKDLGPYSQAVFGSGFDETWFDMQQRALANEQAARNEVIAYNAAVLGQTVAGQQPQNPAPTEAQRKCDQKLASIFGDEGSVAAGSGFEPPNMPGKENQFRGGPNGHLNNAMHLYGSGDGYGEGGVYIPAGGRYIGKNPYSTEDSYMFYYSRLGNARNVTLFTAHVDNFSAPRGTTTGRTRIGDIGGEGGRSPFNPNSPFNQGPYIHAHLAIHQGRGYTGKRLSFFNTFCK